MSDFITLACPSCGGSLRVTEDIERFACKYCGHEHLVRRQQGQVSLVPIFERLERIAGGVDKHAAELAIRRLREDRREVKDRIDDWREELAAARSGRRGKWLRLLFWGLLAAPLLALGLAGLYAMSHPPANGAGNRRPGQPPEDAVCVTLASTGLGACCGLYALGALIQLPGLGRRVRVAEAKLRKFRGRLDEIEADLDRQMRIVEG